MSRSDSRGLFHAVKRVLPPASAWTSKSWVAQPRPRTAGYILILATGTGISVAGALLPLHLSWWWLDTAGHVIGGFTLTLGLLILFSRLYTAIGVVILSLLWEAIEWTIGYPFLVTPADTRLDLIAGWGGMGVALLGTILYQSLVDRTRL
jgi:hypothetical protein